MESLKGPKVRSATDTHDTQLSQLDLAIINSRKTAWDNIDRRKHEILQVYTATSTYRDIMLVGRLTVDFKNGKQVTAEFIARIVFEHTTGEDLQANLYQIWGVCQHLM